MQNERMKGRGLGSMLCAAAALVALVTAVVFFLTQADAAPLGHTGIMPGVALLAGVLVAAILWLVPVRFGALIQAIVYGVALYLSVTQLYLVFADVINQVTYAGGNAGLCVMYMAGAFLSSLLCVIACFFEEPVSPELRASSKRMVPVAGVLAVVLVAGVCYAGLAHGGPAASGTASGSGEAATMSAEDNEYLDKTIEELAATPHEDWVKKEQDGKVAYFFEGQYTEGFATIIDPACLDMYLCEDGSMYGSISGPVTSVAPGVKYLYGAWYTTDESGEKDFVIHLTGTQTTDGVVRATDTSGGEDADIHIFDTEHGDYNWEASFSFGLTNGMFTFTRNINIYGQKYAPAKSMTIDASGLETFYTGDSFDPANLSVTVVRANGSTETIWGGRLDFTGYDSDTAGTKELTGSFLGATATFEVTVDDLVAEHYVGSYDLVSNGAAADAQVEATVDYSHKVVTIAAADGSASITGALLDASSNGTLTMTINGSEPIEATISDAGGAKTLTIPAHQEVVKSFKSSATYDIPESVLTLSE